MESHLASTASTAFGITKSCHLIRKCLESHSLSNYCQGLGTQLYPNQWQDSRSHPAAISSNFFTNASDIPNITPPPTKSPAIGYSLWCGHCYYMNIKDSTSAI